ncbi:MAG TPA: hypothetical protein VGG04_17750 [Candidatus Sulfotelmatobacter sp.]|jgi:hypothetical protein
MRGLACFAASATLLLVCAFAGAASAEDHSSIVIVYKDGHRQSLANAEIARIDLKSPTIVYRDGHREKTGEIDHIEFGESGLTVNLPSRNHFIGKWRVGEGNGDHFYITLEPGGEARKSIGEEHGTWTLVDGEARINWDDGWHDAIRKVGSKHEKLAYEPGKTFGDTPSNVTNAESTEAKPI